jgi:hypothetical protein
MARYFTRCVDTIKVIGGGGGVLRVPNLADALAAPYRVAMNFSVAIVNSERVYFPYTSSDLTAIHNYQTMNPSTCGTTLSAMDQFI